MIEDKTTAKMIAVRAANNPRIKNSAAAEKNIVLRLAPIACKIAVSSVR